MSYNDLEISVIFDNMWEIYPSDERPAAGKKALSVALKMGMDHKEFEQAVKIYALETEGDEYHYHFVNFINDEHWKDILSYHKNALAHIQELERRREMAITIIQKWNEACRPHWCQCLDVELRIPIVVAALANQSFREKWKKALDIASKIFYHERHASDKFQNLSLSLRWFCTIAPSDKHTVMRIIEGEYGKVHRNPVYKNHTPVPLPKEELEALKSDMDEIFADEEWYNKKKEEPKEVKYEAEPNPEIKALVDSLDILIDDAKDEPDEFEFK